mgnify:CR=1 FL=1
MGNLANMVEKSAMEAARTIVEKQAMEAARKSMTEALTDLVAQERKVQW